MRIIPIPREINPPGKNLFKNKLLVRIITPNRQNITPKANLTHHSLMYILKIILFLTFPASKDLFLMV